MPGRVSALQLATAKRQIQSDAKVWEQGVGTGRTSAATPQYLLVSALKRHRDEIALQIHLGEADLKDEWKEWQEKFHQMTAEYDPLKHAVVETTDDVWEALELVGMELKDGLTRLWKAL